MSNAQHTPEPWHTHEVDGVIDIVARNCVPARIHGDSDYEPVARANGNRIVACVNACAGINPEAIRPMLDALKALLGLTLSDNGNQSAAAVEDMARAAITKAEGATP